MDEIHGSGIKFIRDGWIGTRHVRERSNGIPISRRSRVYGASHAKDSLILSIVPPTLCLSVLAYPCELKDIETKIIKNIATFSRS